MTASVVASMRIRRALRVPVLLLALGAATAACGGGDASIRSDPPDSSTTSTSASTLPSSTTTSVPAPTPGVVRFQGLQLTVPTDWTVHDLSVEPTTCARADVHAVYLGTQGADAQCPADGVGVTETLQLAPLDERSQIAAARATKQTTINGLSARVDPDPDLNGALTAVFPDQGVLVILTFGDARAAVDQILASAVLAP